MHKEAGLRYLETHPEESLWGLPERHGKHARYFRFKYDPKKQSLMVMSGGHGTGNWLKAKNTAEKIVKFSADYPGKWVPVGLRK